VAWLILSLHLFLFLAVLKGKKSTEKGKHLSQPGRPDGGSRRTKGKKRTAESSNSDLLTKKSRKEEHRVSSATVYDGVNLQNCTNVTPPNQPGLIYPPFNMPRTMYQSHPDRAYVMPQYRYSGGSNGFPR
jgi:hypothetical protein